MGKRIRMPNYNYWNDRSVYKPGIKQDDAEGKFNVGKPFFFQMCPGDDHHRYEFYFRHKADWLIIETDIIGPQDCTEAFSMARDNFKKRFNEWKSK